MRPIFSIHAGEHLVGTHIQGTNLNVSFVSVGCTEVSVRIRNFFDRMPAAPAHLMRMN